MSCIFIIYLFHNTVSRFSAVKHFSRCDGCDRYCVSAAPLLVVFSSQPMIQDIWVIRCRRLCLRPMRNMLHTCSGNFPNLLPPIWKRQRRMRRVTSAMRPIRHTPPSWSNGGVCYLISKAEKHKGRFPARRPFVFFRFSCPIPNVLPRPPAPCGKVFYIFSASYSSGRKRHG